MARCGGWFLLGGNDVQKQSLRSNPSQTNFGPEKNEWRLRSFGEIPSGGMGTRTRSLKITNQIHLLVWFQFRTFISELFPPKILEKQFGKFRNILCMNLIQKNNVKLQRRATDGALRLRRSHAGAGPIMTLVTYVSLGLGGETDWNVPKRRSALKEALH